MSTHTKRITVIIIVLLAITSLFFYGVEQYIKQTNTAIISRLETAVQAQEVQLFSLAEVTRSNGADSMTDRFINDCKASERQRFDTLLDSLSNNISNTELIELNALFYKCGSFYADQKSIMAIKLSQEVEHLEILQNLQAAIIALPEEEIATLVTWKEIAEAELKTAEYFNTLVDLQGSIITDLLSGKRADSTELVTTLTEVNSVRGQMLVLSKQIEVNKAKLQ